MKTHAVDASLATLNPEAPIRNDNIISVDFGPREVARAA